MTEKNLRRLPWRIGDVIAICAVIAASAMFAVRFGRVETAPEDAPVQPAATAEVSQTAEASQTADSAKASQASEQASEQARENGEREKKPTPPVDRAVLIGVDRYLHFSHLKYASADVDLIRERLEDCLGFQSENIVAITTEAGKDDPNLIPNVANIERELMKAIDATEPDDAIFIFFSGHGFQTDDFGGYSPYVGFAPYDATKTYGVVDFESTFSLSRLFKRLAETEARFKWIVVDACREELEPASEEMILAANGRKRGGLSDDKTALGRLNAPTGSVLLQSCDAGQFSYENDELKHGVFTYYFAESLTENGDENGDGVVRLLEAINLTTNAVENATARCQQPRNSIDSQNFPLVSFLPPSGPSEDAEGLYRAGRAAVCGLEGSVDAKRGFKQLKQAADAGLPGAQGELALLYLNGCDGTPVDVKKGAAWAARSASRGDPFGLRALGDCYYKGLGVVKNVERARELYKRANKGLAALADAGDPIAAWRLGWAFKTGLGLETDEETAFRLLKQAVDGECSAAFNALGVCYGEGCGVEASWPTAARYFLDGARRGDPSAKSNLGVYYYSLGAGGGKDTKLALDFWREAAEMNYAPAMLQLARALIENSEKNGDSDVAEEAKKWAFKAVDAKNGAAARFVAVGYERGYWGETDLKKAFEYYSLGADWEDPASIALVGNCYYYAQGVDENKEEAARFFRRAIAQPTIDKAVEAEVKFNLAVCIQFGGAGGEPKEAAELYRESADLGLDAASYNLGFCYDKGFGVKENKKEAARLYREASEGDDNLAPFALGLCYLTGEGVERDLEEALRLFKIGAARGDGNAICALGVCYWGGFGVERDEAEAEKWLTQEAGARQGVAAYFLGSLYFKDDENPKKRERAAELFQKAFDLGVVGAARDLARCYREGIGVETDEEKAERLEALVGGVEEFYKGDTDDVSSVLFGDFMRALEESWDAERPTSSER